MKSALQFGFTLTVAFLFTACGASPIFRHTNANDLRLVAPQIDAPKCPLSFAKSGICAAIEWTKAPSGDETGSFRLRFWNPKDATRDGPYVAPPDTVAVKLWMPEMGHGSSPVKINVAKSVDGTELPGEYDVSQIFFIMPGAWEIHVQLKNGSVLEDESVASITI